MGPAELAAAAALADKAQHDAEAAADRLLTTSRTASRGPTSDSGCGIFLSG